MNPQHEWATSYIGVYLFLQTVFYKTPRTFSAYNFVGTHSWMKPNHDRNRRTQPTENHTPYSSPNHAMILFNLQYYTPCDPPDINTTAPWIYIHPTTSENLIRRDCSSSPLSFGKPHLNLNPSFTINSTIYTNETNIRSPIQRLWIDSGVVDTDMRRVWMKMNNPVEIAKKSNCQVSLIHKQLDALQEAHVQVAQL